MPSTFKLKALLIDLNGTLHVGNTLTPRAVEALERLRAAKIPFVFCSNSTKEAEARLLNRLHDMGLPASANELITSLGACRALVEKRGLTPFLLLSPEAKEEFAAIDFSKAPDAVVLGLHPASFDYDNLNTAFRVLKGEPLPQCLPGSPPPVRTPVLIAPHTAGFHQAPDGPEFPSGLSLGIGAYVRALEAASGVTAEVVGKPTRGFYELAMGRVQDVYDIPALDPAHVAIVGDDVNNDLGAGAQELGLRRVLVRTGKYRPGVEKNGSPPDEVHDSFADFVDALLASA